MNLQHLQKLVKLEEDSREFDVIHDAVIGYIFSLSSVKSEIVNTFYSETAKEILPIPSQEVINLGMYKGKIEGVRLYKSQTGQSLLNSKRAVEDWFEFKGFSFKKW